MTPPADLSALVAELRKLDEAATRAPWVYHDGQPYPLVSTGEDEGNYTWRWK